MKLPKLFKNKYAWSLLAFAIWLTFIDQNNLITQVQYRMELSKLEDEQRFYQQEIKKIKEDLNELESNPKSLEKFAREKYFMKKENEELFVLIEE
ncbi:MAG: septum formation initiator [Verrucomicrobia bacterium]|nr:septum formation initiator [Verrucomicrobiota bacterium]|tara:strand:- start:553 stop:837 length:285 start_codon:yes stop_codon:yes gene_type:complete